MNSPAFLFYSKDWIADTADWEPESKGVYIDLLAHQHVNGLLPNDERKLARVARLSPDEFSKIWETIKHKFIIEGDHVVNHRLNQVIEENQQKALKNKINGCFAAKIKMLNLPLKRLNELKKLFDYQMFVSFSDEEIKDEVYKWVNQMVNHVDDQTDNNNVDVNENVNINISVLFENFRKQFPGTKRGKDIELENFLKKNKPETVELLLPALQSEIAYRDKLKETNQFIPEWKNITTWINKKCWTQEFPEVKKVAEGNVRLLQNESQFKQPKPLPAI
jgi:hypothetical protein